MASRRNGKGSFKFCIPRTGPRLVQYVCYPSPVGATDVNQSANEARSKPVSPIRSFLPEKRSGPQCYSRGRCCAGVKGSGLFANRCSASSWVRAKTSRAAMRCCKKQKWLQMLCQAGCCGSMHCIAHCRSSSRRASRFSRLATSCCIARFCVERTSCCASSCSVHVCRAAMCSACMSCCDGAAESCDADEDVRKSWRRGPTKHVHASR